MIKIDLGTPKKKRGWLTIDIAGDPSILHDLNGGIPYQDNICSELKAENVIEHLEDIIDIMDEIWRVCCNGALVHIIVPGNYYAYALDPTHKHPFTADTFLFFTKKMNEMRQIYGIKSNFKILSINEVPYKNNPKEVSLKVELEVLK